jgi:hypothetical integral membrane protein (TIGR02206 family)
VTILADAANTFETFAAPHIVAIAATVLIATALPIWARRAGSARLTRSIAWIISIVLLVNEFAYYLTGLYFEPQNFLTEYLPLHICGTATFLTAWVLVRPNRYLFEVAFFWGLAGTLQAVLTPNITEGFPSYWFFRFFVTHSGIVIGVAFATWGMRQRPGRGAILRAIVVGNLYMGVVALANWILDANYMFLCKPPEGASPLFFLPWPWYIVFLELVGIVLAAALFLPFTLADQRGARRPLEE